MKPVLASLLACLVAVAALAGEAPPAFAAKPSAQRAGDKTTISFAASVPTDAAVYILDAQGKCVRHLVAGVIAGPSTGLGPGGSPPEPLKPGLAQTVEWDGRDDAGKPAAGGPFRVRVTLGLKPEFDGFLLDNPAATGAVTAMAVGPGGQIYLWHRDNTANGNQGTNKLKVLDRDGRYVRTLMPYSADLAPEKAKVFGAFTDADGGLVPRIYNLQQLSIYYEASGERGRAMPDNCSPAVDATGRAYWLGANGRLEAVEADGSSAYDTFPSEPLFAALKFVRGDPVLCVSGDGKSLYVAGLQQADDEWGKNARAVPCVWRVDVAARKAEVCLGKPDQPGKEKELLAAPRGLAAAKGLLYVADPGADRVAVFKEADRSFVGEIKVPSPQSLGVDPATGAVYACVYTGKGTADLVLFAGYENAREVCRLAMPKAFGPGPQRIAVDSSAKPVRIWQSTLGWQSGEIYCFEDAGGKLVPKGDPRDLKAPWGAGPRDLTLDRSRGELYVKHGVQRYWRLDGRTGKVTGDIGLRNVAGHLDSHATQLVVSPDGSLITYGGMGIRRLDRDGKPLNWPGRDSNVIVPSGGIMTFMQRFLAVPSPEELFVILPPEYRKGKGDDAGSNFSSLNVLGPDGGTRRTVVWQCSTGAVPRVDAKGNIYLAEMLKPPDRSYPEFLHAKWGKYASKGFSVTGGKFAADPELMSRFWNSNMYGSIVKFPPSGGVIWFEPKLPASVEGAPPAELLAKPRKVFGKHIGYDEKPVEVQGAEWVRFGFAPYGVTRGAGFCMCEGVGFDVDGFGRVFYPNLGQFRIEVVDTANNWIGSFGRYGNQDSGGKDAKVKKPEMPLAWPTYVAVGDDCAFVNDTVSNRVVRVKLGAAAEETCEVR